MHFDFSHTVRENQLHEYLYMKGNKRSENDVTKYILHHEGRAILKCVAI